MVMRFVRRLIDSLHRPFRRAKGPDPEIFRIAQQKRLRAQAREIYAEQQKRVVAVFDNYAKAAGCPCDWPQFVYWTGKTNGLGGFHDIIQNDLVIAAIKSGVFDAAPQDPERGLGDVYVCKRCGATWLHMSDEWRMCAYAETLKRKDGGGPDISHHAGLVSDRTFATAGREPNTRTLSLDEWEVFMSSPPG